MYVPLFADIIAAERWLMIMPMAVGTSVCAALVAAAQMQNNSFSHEQKKAAGSTHGFIFFADTCGCMFNSSDCWL